MIRYLYRSTKSDELKELDSYKAGAWIYVENTNDDEVRALAEKHGLNSGILLDVLDEDEMPRLELEDGTNYLFTRFVHPEDDLHMTTEVILIVVREDLVMTLSRQPIPSIDRIVSGHREVHTTMRTKLFVQLLHGVIDGYDMQLNRVGRQVKNIRNRLRIEEVSNQDFINFVLIEDELNEFLTVLTPTSAVLKRLLVGKHLKLFDEDADIIEDLMLSTEQSIEESRAILRSIVNIREAYSTIATNNLNHVIRTLTIITTLLAIPTLIASIYGMNIRLPFDDQDNAFTIVMLLSLAVTSATLLFFKWRKWL